MKTANIRRSRILNQKMLPLDQSRITTLLQPYAKVTDVLVEQLATYLDLLLRWNARTNLTAVRDPEEMVTRHFGESLFAAAVLAETAPAASSLLDLGSGAGFPPPALPIQLALPALRVTLAESQNKKATFLREVIRTLNLPTAVYAGRAEFIPPDQTFDIVTMRAVDNPVAAFQAAIQRIPKSGLICLLATADTPCPEGLITIEPREMPGSNRTAVHLFRRS